MNTLALIPHYNHGATVGAVVAAMRACGLDVLIVDDGSEQAAQAVLADLVQPPGIHVHYHSANRGKGAAVKTGLQYAAMAGYSHVLQIDADAQHRLADSVTLLAAAAAAPTAVICGWPQYGSDAPKARRYGRKITDFWNRLHTASGDIKDGMCGFRVYPVAAALAVVCEEYVGERMDFDTEILVRLHWRGTPFRWVPTPVHYAPDGVSHFRAWEDNILISKMHARLFCTMLWRRLSRGSVRPRS